jgi:hypothetical protein
MHRSLEFILGILERDSPPCVAQEDFDGLHGTALRLWQEMGFLRQEPGAHFVPSCPHCGEGVPYPVGDRLLCSACGSRVDPQHLLLWEFDLQTFLWWLSRGMHLQGGTSRVDDCLWQLGRLVTKDSFYECFFQRGHTLLETGRQRLSAYRNVLLLYCLRPPSGIGHAAVTARSLLQMLWLEKTLTLSDPAPLLRPQGAIRFERHSGALWAGDTWLGEVPVGSKEFFFLDCLVRELDHFVSYADIKQYVLRQSGGSDSTEEATFCQQLKNRIKRKKWITEIDRLVVTTNKGEGYRLRGWLES